MLKKGALIEELEMLQSSTLPSSSTLIEGNSEEILCIEAESTAKKATSFRLGNGASGIGQLRDYMAID